MANPLLPLSLLAALAGGLGYGVIKTPDTPVEREAAFDPKRQALAATLWMISNAETDDICLIEKTRQVTVSTATIQLDDACRSVLETGVELTGWQQDDLGNVTLVDEQGFPVLEFNKANNDDLLAMTTTRQRLLLSPES